MDRRQAMKTLALGAAAIPLIPGGALAFRAAAPPVAGTGPGAAPAVTPPAAVPPAAAPPGPFTLPPLGYAFDALEPHLDAQTMQIHHGKHHAAYVNNLNKAVAGRKEVEGWPVEQLLREIAKVPEEIRTAVRNQGGGHANHSLFWPSLRRDGAKRPSGELADAIERAFSSFEAFRSKFDAAAGAVFGSGWAWLVTGANGAVRVTSTPNQDSPLMLGDTPLLGIDVWEHAYYLRYQNRRADYVATFHQVVDWDAVSARYRDATRE